jgi:1,2-diacylglycerol-3-alpha-glucose alpha-1,2-galactosyltransferase
MISESTFTVRGHGVHTAFEECLAALQLMPDVRRVSGWRSIRRGVTLHAHTVGPVALAQLLVHPGSRVVSAHITPDSFVGSVRGARPLLGAVRRYLRFVYDRADVVLAVSDATAAEVVELGVRSPVITVRNAIDGERLRLLGRQRALIRRTFGWDDGVTVLAVGQVQPRKGIADFITCARALPDLRFVWVGGMPFGVMSAQRGPLLRACREAPKNCEFTGLLTRDRVFEYYAAADIFFLPSKHETFGLATLEAATASLPLVLTDLDCYREWLGSGAYLSGGRADDYMTRLRSLADSAALRRQMGSRAAESAVNHDLSALVAGMRRAYGLAAA